jgi:hypothetical protein
MLKYILADFHRNDKYYHIMYTDPNILSNLQLYCPHDYSPAGFVCENVKITYYTSYNVFWLDKIDHAHGHINGRPHTWKPDQLKLWELYDKDTINTIKNTKTFIQGGHIYTDIHNKYNEKKYNTNLQLLSQDGNWFVDLCSYIYDTIVRDNAIIIRSDVNHAICAGNCIIVDSKIYGCDDFKISGYTLLKNITICSLSSVQLYNVSICNELTNYIFIIHIMEHHPNVCVLNITFSLNYETLEYFEKHVQKYSHNISKILNDAEDNGELGVIEITDTYGQTLYTVPLSQFIKDFS